MYLVYLQKWNVTENCSSVKGRSLAFSLQLHKFCNPADVCATVQVLDIWRVVLRPPRLSVGRYCKLLWRWHVLLQPRMCPWDPRGMKQSGKNGTQDITFIQTAQRRDVRSGEINPNVDLSFPQSH